MIISLLVAADENNVIGKDNTLPWHLPNDLKYFKNVTWGMPIVMGRKTYDSIGKPLPGRHNIVLTHNQSWQAAGVDVVHSVEEAVNTATKNAIKEIFIIGGAEVFKTLLPKANKLYLTRIHHQFEGDVYLPQWQNEDWQLVSEKFCDADEKNKYPHTFQVWEKQQP